MKTHQFLWGCSAFAVITMITHGKSDQAETWFISGIIAFITFIVGCVFKALDWDKEHGETTTRDALLVWLVWKVFGILHHDD